MTRCLPPWAVTLAALGALGALGTPAGAQDRPAEPATETALRLGVFFWHQSPNDESALLGIRHAFEQSRHPHEFLVEQANGDRATARAILKGFLEQRVDLIFAMGTQAALLAREQEVAGGPPIVFTAVTHPVESGVVESWKGSGGNLAGNSNWIAPATVVRVFRLAVPHLRRLGMLRSATSNVVSAAELHGIREYLKSDGAPRLDVVEAIAKTDADIRAAALELLAKDVQAIWIGIDFAIYQHAQIVFDAARERGIPIVTTAMQAANTVAVAGVSPDYELLGQRAAVIALEILLRDTAPAGIPIGTMHGYQVVVNLDAARKCGYELPLSTLVLADRIVGSATGTDGAEKKRDQGR